MADLQNPSFETPDTEWGQAEYWDEAYDACGEDVGEFWNGIRLVPFESFEGGWPEDSNGPTSFSGATSEAGMFEQGSMDHEPFEYSWSVTGSMPWNHQDAFYFDPDNFVFGMFNSGVDDVEDFESDWSNDDDVEDFGDATTSEASFDSGTPESAEDFEEEWDNDNDVANFGAATTSTGSFDSALTPENFEDFEEGWTETLP